MREYKKVEEVEVKEEVVVEVVEGVEVHWRRKWR